MRRGSVFQRHARSCPRDEAGRLQPHRCRSAWAYHLLAGTRADGRRRQVTQSGFPTKRAAELALAEAIAREDAGVAEVHGLTVGDYLRQWLAGKRALRDSSRRNYESDIRRYLEPALGRLRLADLRPHHIDLCYGDLLADPTGRVTAATVRHAHATLRAALNTAVKRRLIPWNPALHVELPSQDRPPVTVWTPEQLGRFLDATGEHRLYALFHLIAVAGLRRGEALGLHWQDVDFERGAIHVRLQLVDAGGGARLGPPKTKRSSRVVPLDQGTVAVLHAHRVAQQRDRAVWGDAWHDTDLVFTREDGRALRPDSVTHLFWQLTARAGVPRIRLHDVRHTSASVALAAGVPIKVVSDRLGHSSTAITADLYTHVIPAVAQDAAERIAALIPRAAGRPGPGPAQPPSSKCLAQEINIEPGEGSG